MKFNPPQEFDPAMPLSTDSVRRHRPASGGWRAVRLALGTVVAPASTLTCALLFAAARAAGRARMAAA